MLGSPNQTVNQIRRSYKNDQSNIFVTVGPLSNATFPLYAYAVTDYEQPVQDFY